MTFEAANEKQTVLVIDDAPEVISSLKNILSESYTVKAAISGELGLAVVEKQHPDLILLDIMMPGLDGYEVCKRIKENAATRDIPVIFLSAKTETDDEQKGFELGAVDYVQKPVSPPILLARVKTQLFLYDQQRELDRQVKERTRELSTTRIEIIQRLGRAAEYRDNETGKHVIRVGNFCQTLALAHGLPEDFAELIRHAAPMHDIGKVGISDNILLKPGKLTDDEYEIMKTHCIIGSMILEGSNYELMRMANDIALSHHEKWDGSGYPHGLKGEEIPIEGRITAVADVFDALCSERPYKTPWPIEKAVDFFNEQAGKHFDPALIETFHKVLPRFQEIQDEYKD